MSAERELANVILNPLLTILERSWKLGKDIQHGRRGDIDPIFKKGNKEDPFSLIKMKISDFSFHYILHDVLHEVLHNTNSRFFKVASNFWCLHIYSYNFRQIREICFFRKCSQNFLSPRIIKEK